ncbi:hypothetical protein J2788_006248 [Variovorax paradoxus]|nr:hypothetical protein [Variovorax paradoxus]
MALSMTSKQRLEGLGDISRKLSAGRPLSRVTLLKRHVCSNPEGLLTELCDTSRS